MDTMKVGNLAGIKVFKFKMNTNQFLMAYKYDDKGSILTLIAWGSHENVYRDLKNKV
ncbi:MAG: type II toxin-antitoxin system RelE/ParE family toxin [Sedimenticola sp.]